MLPGYFWEDTRLFPLYGVGTSAALLALSFIRERWTHPSPKYAPVLHVEDEDCAADSVAQQPGLRCLVQRAGGPAVLRVKLTRLVCCVLLLGLSLTTLLRRHIDTWRTDGAPWWPELVECEVYSYASVLALAWILSRRPGKLLAAHLNSVLLVVLGVYTYRDVLPLLLRNRDPADAADGVFLWLKMLLLLKAAVALPLLAPRTYKPYNPSEPMANPGKEQTSSIFSLVTFSWLNETVSKASHVEHLPLDEFPPLADSNATKNLTERSFKEIDPFQLGKDEHLFWGLLRVFRNEYLLFSALAALGAVLTLSRAIAAKGLLAYLEVGGPKSNAYPWAWALLLLVGPTAVTFCEEWNQWIISVVSARLEAVVTELLFEHSLRIRVKAESSVETETTAGGAIASDKKGQLLGRLNNLVTSDLSNVKNGNKFWLQLFVEVPVLIGSSIIFVYNVLGWSAIIGLACMCALLPVPGYLSSWIQSFQAGKMAKTDARVQLINEILNVVRMIKLFGWERRVTSQVEERREAELKFIRKTKFLELTNNLINFSIPLFTMVFTFAAYTMLFGGELTASRLFSSYTAFETIQHQMHMIFFVIPVLTQARVSLDRLNEFIHNTELLDEFEEKKAGRGASADFAPRPVQQDMGVLGIARTTFTWAKDREGSTPSTPATSEGRSQRKFVLDVEDEVIFKRGSINLIVGPTGSGKTSLLMALLGEMHAIPSGPDSFVSIPRTGGVAYAAQESWIQSETIRENILFGSAYDEVRYNKVIKQCALERDLSLFDAGDQTEVGEKGITLSGGQKARITLARAVYSSAEVLLLDDVLAALDVHTGHWIVDKCFKGDLIRGRTVILVSHNVALTRPVAEFVVALGTDGRIVSQGSFDKALKEDQELQAELAAEKEELDKADEEIDTPPLEGEAKDGKLVVAEEISVGRVGWKAFMLYFGNVAQSTWIPAYWAAYVGTLCITHVGINGQTYFLGYWAAQYENRAPSEISVPYYVTQYCLIVFVLLAVYATSWSLYVYGNIRASRLIHKNLLASVLGTTLRWLDTTPTSRIIARCTADIQSVDSEMARELHSVVEGAIFMILKIGSVAFMLPIYIVPSVIVAVLGALISQVYMRAQLSVKREMSNAKAPVLGHFGSAIAGLVSIRAYGAQEAFKQESYARMDRYNRAGLTYEALNRWVTIRVDILGSALSAVLAAYLAYGANLSASNAGFAMAMAVGFSSFILGWLKMFYEFQVTANSLERIQQYMTIEQEPKPTKEGVPPAYWPASGDLRVEKLTARYSSDGPAVLHGLSFEVKSGERVGIVGRTGSGKSSLTLALLRCIVTEGKVYYDGIPTDSMNLDALRSNITIIPQMPELLSGTLRQNLDPFGQHDDATLNDALRSAGLFSLQEEGDHARITLDSEIAGGGGNLSVGQRQIIALARAIVRRSKLLILDEATSAIDYETDSVIQKSLREELGRDVTVLTVAHRLQSIMDADRIMVLDAGNLVEYDKPSELLKKEGGYFRSLVDESGDKAALYRMAGYAA